MLSRASFRIITRYNKTDLKGVVAGVCPHYLVLMVLEASNPENHAHHFQILDSLKHRFGLERAFTDIACRMVKMLETLNADLEIDLPAVLQSYLHGSFHEWVCLVIRGFPWNPELGRFTGEEAERFFGTLIKLLASLSQQSRLRRAYTLHRFITSWNHWKTANMHTFLADRLARVAKDWEQNLAALEELGAMTTTMFETSLQHWQVCFSSLCTAASY